MTRLAVLAFVLWAAPARAQFVGHTAGFITLDRMDSVSRVGLDFAGATYDGIDNNNLFTQLQVYGQYAAPAQHWGIYGMMPVSYAFIENADDEGAAGNLELGAFLHAGPRSSEGIGRLGISLPTAATSVEGVLTNVYAGYWRLTDMFMSVSPKTTWLRASGSLRGHSGQIFLRGDLGFDIPVARDQGDKDVLMHVNGALGIWTVGAAFTIELVNVGDISAGHGFSQDFVDNLCLSVATTGPGRLHAAFILPLDDEPRGDLWMFAAGYQSAF